MEPPAARSERSCPATSGSVARPTASRHVRRTCRDAGKAVNRLHGMPLKPRPGTALPATAHIGWHRREVFKGRALAA
jgi:hypothetical protein